MIKKSNFYDEFLFFLKTLSQSKHHLNLIVLNTFKRKIYLLLVLNLKIKI
jgi:hypothetical protein